MAKRTELQPPDVGGLEYPVPAMEPFARFLLGLLQSRGYDHGPRGPRGRGEKASIKQFALQHGVLYQTLWEAVRGQRVPKDDFTVAACKALGLRQKEEIFVCLLLAHQAKTPAPYRDQYGPIIQDLARKTGLEALLR